MEKCSARPLFSRVGILVLEISSLKRYERFDILLTCSVFSSHHSSINFDLGSEFYSLHMAVLRLVSYTIDRIVTKA